jgi:V8-like Glu-specific endopeptidase
MMRILRDKNMAFGDQPAPSKGAAREVKAVKAKKTPPLISRDVSLFLAGDAQGKVEHALEIAEEAKSRDEVRLRFPSVRAGTHAFPPAIGLKAVEPLGNKARGFDKPLIIDGCHPAHLDLRPVPKEVPEPLRRPAFTLPDTIALRDRHANRATTVFAPDNRMVFFDTSYPWSTCGRVDTPGGQASGAMVGPRHLLTVSHAIQWLADGGAGWVRFRPMLFDTSAPFGEAWGTLIYHKVKVTGPTIDWIEGMNDYVVVVLDRRIGEVTGWLGGKGYSDSWDGGNYWSHVGYPGDLTSGMRPTFQGNFPLDGAWWQFDSAEQMAHQADVWPGQSGGPVFGWWGGSPYAVAVQSSQNSSENNASGGQDLVDLIIRAREEHP